MNAPKITKAQVACPVLRHNIDRFNEKLQMLNRDYGTGDLADFEMSVLHKAFEDKNNIPNLGLYCSFEETLTAKYQISENHISDVIKFLEYFAYMYVSLYTAQFLKPTFESFDNYLGKVIISANKLEKLVVDEKDLILTMMKISQLLDGESHDYNAAIDDLVQSLETLREIRREFRSSLIAKQSQLGVKAPVTHDGLYEWVFKMTSMWTQGFVRTIENKYDGINGRKHLLDFMCDCMEPLNPSLEYATLDNMLRKVQRTQAEAVNS